MSDDGTGNTIIGGIFFNAVIQGRDITVSLPPEITPAMTGLPPTTPTFTGRNTDLAILLDTLTPPPTGSPADAAAPTTALIAAAIGGMGGIGKTELAIQAARTALSRGWFPGGVLFADLRGYDGDPALRGDPGQALEGFLRAVGVPGQHVPPAVEDRSRLLRSVLAAYAAEGRRVLVVADNVSTGGQAVPLLPSDGVCAAIVTSRHVLADLDARLLNLDTLPTSQAVELLEAALRLRDPADTRVRDHPEDAVRLVGSCAGLPLAVQIVAAQLAAAPVKPLVAQAADLADAASRLAEMAFADRAVNAVFDTSYQQLPADQARLFRLLSLNPGPDLSTPAVAALSGMSEAEARRGLEALAHAHLIEPSAGMYGRWRLHDLLRLHSAHHATTRSDADQRGQALTRLLDHYLTTTRAANAHLDPATTDPAQLGFPNLETALGWLDGEYANLTAVALTAEQAGHPAIARDLPATMFRFMDRRRHFNDWISLTHAALHAARTLNDRRGQASALSTLGVALQEVRRFEEAITAHQDAAQIYRDTDDRHGQAGALNNLGIALQEVRRFEEAITAHQQDLQICRELGDRHGEGAALNNLGVALRQVGRFEEAITAHQDAAQILRDTGDHHSEGQALNNLGNALQQVRRFEEAITAYQGAAQIYRDTGDRHGEGSALNNLGVALRQMGRFEEAITAHQDAAQIYRDTRDRHGEGTALNNLGNALQQVRRFEEAITAHQQDLQICRELGDLHSEGMALGNLGLALAEVRRFEEAITAQRTAAQIFHEFGDDNSETIARDYLQETLRSRDAASAEQPD